MYTLHLALKMFPNQNENCEKNVSDREDSLITSWRPPGRHVGTPTLVNSLPEDIVSADHLSLFVRLLNRVDLSQFLVGKA